MRFTCENCKFVDSCYAFSPARVDATCLNFELETTPEEITELKHSQIFVFGSNTDGRHGKGAALTAVRKFGARYGKGEGLYGQSYALPTVGNNLSHMDLDRVKIHVDRFIKCAKEHPELEFLVTKVGCGLAGHKERDIAPMFKDCPENCILPEGWR